MVPRPIEAVYCPLREGSIMKPVSPIPLTRETTGLRPFLLPAACPVIAGGMTPAVLHAPFVPELMADTLVRWVPMSVFSLVLRWLGEAAKWVALAGCIVLYWVGMVAVNWALFSLRQRLRPFFGRAPYPAGSHN